MLLLSKYKWYIAAILFLVYSAATWNVASVYNERNWVDKELKQTRAVLVEKEKNEKLATELIAALRDKNSLQKQIAEESWRKIFDEVATNPIYNTCLVTDGVRNAIQKQLDSQ